MRQIGVKPYGKTPFIMRTTLGCGQRERQPQHRQLELRPLTLGPLTLRQQLNGELRLREFQLLERFRLGSDAGLRLRRRPVHLWWLLTAERCGFRLA